MGGENSFKDRVEEMKTMQDNNNSKKLSLKK